MVDDIVHTVILSNVLQNIYEQPILIKQKGHLEKVSSNKINFKRKF